MSKKLDNGLNPSETAKMIWRERELNPELATTEIGLWEQTAKRQREKTCNTEMRR